MRANLDRILTAGSKSLDRATPSPQLTRDNFEFYANGTVFQMPTHVVIVTCNKLAMTALSSENFKECQIFLKRAEGLVQGMQERL